MSRFSQFKYSAGPAAGQGSLLGRLIAFVVGVIVLGISVFVGAIFIAGMLGLILLGSLVFMLRVWWVKRKMAQYQAVHGDLEGEYTVVTEEVRRVDRETH